MDKEHISVWHTEREDCDYRYHYYNADNWWVEYREKVIKDGKNGELGKEVA